jgi:hypothetical protein
MWLTRGSKKDPLKIKKLITSLVEGLSTALTPHFFEKKSLNNSQSVVMPHLSEPVFDATPQKWNKTVCNYVHRRSERAT